MEIGKYYYHKLKSNKNIKIMIEKRKSMEAEHKATEAVSAVAGRSASMPRQCVPTAKRLRSDATIV